MVMPQTDSHAAALREFAAGFIEVQLGAHRSFDGHADAGHHSVQWQARLARMAGRLLRQHWNMHESASCLEVRGQSVHQSIKNMVAHKSSR